MQITAEPIEIEAHRMNAHLKAVLHLETLVLQLLHAGDLLERYITDGLFALRLRIAERVGGEAEVALFELPAKTLPGCRILGHQAVGRKGEKQRKRGLSICFSISRTQISLFLSQASICNQDKNRANCSIML